MKKIVVTLTDETDEMLRRFVKDTYFDRRGALSIAVEAALIQFLKQNGYEPNPE